MSMRFIGEYVFASLLINNKLETFNAKSIDDLFNKINLFLEDQND